MRPRMRHEPSRLVLESKGRNGLVGVSFTATLADTMTVSVKGWLLTQLLASTRPVPLHVVISADAQGDWRWAGHWQAALAEVRAEGLYVFHSLGGIHDGR